MKSVFVTNMIPESGVVRLADSGLSIKMNPVSRPLRRDELMEEAGKHDAIMCQCQDRVDREVLQAAAPRCRIVALCSVGFDNVDLEAARDSGVIVTHTPDVLTEATADLTWGLLLATARRLGEAERFLRAGAWRGWGMLDFLGADVHGKTLGIIGAGRIGTAVAKRAAGFNMKILYFARGPKPEIEAAGGQLVSRDDLLSASDFVSLHVPLTGETHHMIDERALGLMKRGAILINTARGPAVDHVALIDALRDGPLAGAGLDVYDKEPSVPEALLEMDNVVLLPHIGSATVSARMRMAEVAAENVIAVLDGGAPLNPVIVS